MIGKLIIGALASAALAVAAPSPAKPGNGHGHANKPAKASKPAKAQQARARSQGPAHASPRALERASQNSVLHGSSVVAGPLTGLTVGSAVVDSNGGPLGTVERINSSSGGTVRNVLVRSATGSRIIPLDPAGLSLDGATLVTSSTRRGRDD